jgi:hypothetical protein
MADKERPTPAESPVFETDAVQADRAREQGLGLGERELNAQRDPGGVRTPTKPIRTRWISLSVFRARMTRTIPGRPIPPSDLSP